MMPSYVSDCTSTRSKKRSYRASRSSPSGAALLAPTCCHRGHRSNCSYIMLLLMMLMMHAQPHHHRAYQALQGGRHGFAALLMMHPFL